MRPTIVIPSPMDSKYGFLSLSSHHTFNIDDKVWPTISHFMLAKQFEGTVFEEEIRKAGSVTLAKSMARPRRVIIQTDERAIKKTIYGSNKIYEIRNDWKDPLVVLSYLKMATTAKFDQNPKLKRKLIDSEGMKIEDPANKEYGALLEELRDLYILEIARKKEPPKDHFRSLIISGYVDSKKVTSENDVMISSFFTMVKSIRELEGLDRYYPEMFEDVITNLVPLEISEELIKHIGLWIDFVFEGWSTITKNMPVFENLVRIIEKRVITEALAGLGKPETLRVATFIASFIRWLNFDAKPDTVAIILKNATMITKKTIFIPAKPRLYRKDAPLFVSKTRKPKKYTSISFKGVSKFDRVDMSESRGKIFISGKDAGIYETRLLELGGRRKGEFIELPLSAKVEVESLFYDSQPDYEHRVNAVYRAWCQKKVELVMDMASQISHLISKPPGLRVYKIVARMCGLQQRVDIEGLPRPADAQSIMVAAKLPSKIQNFLSHFFTPLTFPEKGKFEEICAGWDKECGWKNSNPAPLVSRLFTKDQCYVIKSMKSIVDIATLPGKGLGYPHTLEVVVWAFLSLTPKPIRKDAQKYVNLVLDGYVSEDDHAKAAIHLKKANINLNLKDLDDYMRDAGMGEVPSVPSVPAVPMVPSVPAVPMYMLIVIAIAISFISHREQEFRYRTLILQGFNKKKEVLEIETVEQPEQKDETLVPKARRDFENSTIPKGVVNEVEGDIVNFQDATWVLAIANASSKKPFKPKTKSEIITSKIYKKYAYANVYRSPNPRSPGVSITSIPKDESVNITSASTAKHRYVATLIAEHSEGGAKKIGDTSANRKLWFTQALEGLGSLIKKGESIAISNDYLEEGYRESFESFAEKFCYQTWVVQPKKKLEPPTIEISKMPETLEKSGGDEKSRGDPKNNKTDLDEDEEINRGILYSKLFKPHKLPAESHSKLVTHLERCVPKIREAWLEKFMEVTPADQKLEIDMILE